MDPTVVYAPRVVGRKQLLWAGLAAGAIQLVGFVSNYLVGLATGDKGSPTLLVVAGVVSVIGGTITLFLQQAIAPKPPAPAAPPAPTPQPGYAPQPEPRRSTGGMTVVLGLILVIVLCGVGGTAVNSLVTKLVESARSVNDHFPTPFVSDPPATFKPVLAKEVSARSGALTLKVTGVEVNDKTTRLIVTAVNTDSRSMDLPLFKNCTLTIAGQPTLEADPKSTWAITVPGNGEITGTIIFPGGIPAGTTKTKLSFATVFRLGGGSISVDIPLTMSS